MFSLFNSFFIACDAPKPWGIYFQDSASPQMEALVELHDNIMFYLVIISFAVGWILICIIRNYVNHKYPNKFFNHGSLVELIWTITPAIILISIAYTSVRSLNSMHIVMDPFLIVFVEGQLLYSGYLYPDLLNYTHGFYSGTSLDGKLYIYLSDNLSTNGNTNVGDIGNASGSIDTGDGSSSSSGSNHSGSSNNDDDDNESLDVPERESEMARCLHERYMTYPEDDVRAPVEQMCDLNPTRLPNGTLESHPAFRGGLSPVVCGDCFAVICRDCTDPDYATDASLGSSPIVGSPDSDAEFERVAAQLDRAAAAAAHDSLVSGEEVASGPSGYNSNRSHFDAHDYFVSGEEVASGPSGYNSNGSNLPSEEGVNAPTTNNSHVSSEEVANVSATNNSHISNEERHSVSSPDPSIDHVDQGS